MLTKLFPCSHRRHWVSNNQYSEHSINTPGLYSLKYSLFYHIDHLVIFIFWLFEFWQIICIAIHNPQGEDIYKTKQISNRIARLCPENVLPQYFPSSMFDVHLNIFIIINVFYF